MFLDIQNYKDEVVERRSLRLTEPPLDVHEWAEQLRLKLLGERAIHSVESFARLSRSSRAGLDGEVVIKVDDYDVGLETEGFEFGVIFDAVETIITARNLPGLHFSKTL
ncbi:hypothetical protein H0V99_03220 [Candidatus Saccharibacteria bacterium]|nr:hypothetical protein [Candidatus Saccharibacteria bacterium]